MNLYNIFNRMIKPILFLGILFLLSCQDSPEKAVDELKIGLLINATTPGGFHTRSAAKIFMEETEEKIKAGHLNDLSIKIVEKEIDLTPESAIQATRDLVFRERVNIVVGPNVSISALAAGSICELAKVPMISPGATNSGVSHGKEFIYQVAFTDTEQGAAISKLMLKQFKTEPVSVVYQISNPASKEVAESFIESFSKNDGKIIHTVSYSIFDDKAVDRISQLDFRNDKWILLPNLHQDSMRQVKLLRKLGFTGRFIGSDAWSPIESAKILEANNSILSQHWFPKAVTFDYRSKEFTQDFYQNFNSLPTSTAALTYDTLNLLIDHINNAGLSVQNLALDLADVRYMGITGEIILSAKRSRLPVFLILNDNEISLLNSENSTIEKLGGDL